ncbi:hypothetical protein SAMN05216489_03743 [Streptomyces sp. 3213]|nr:hypothetical protein SAMN05216489_03743 [Streptomyces sp. 3213] [Streptomyces sp. 3213.3]
MSPRYSTAVCPRSRRHRIRWGRDGTARRRNRSTSSRGLAPRRSRGSLNQARLGLAQVNVNNAMGNTSWVKPYSEPRYMFTTPPTNSHDGTAMRPSHTGRPPVHMNRASTRPRTPGATAYSTRRNSVRFMRPRPANVLIALTPPNTVTVKTSWRSTRAAPRDRGNSRRSPRASAAPSNADVCDSDMVGDLASVVPPNAGSLGTDQCPPQGRRAHRGPNDAGPRDLRTGSWAQGSWGRVRTNRATVRAPLSARPR